MEMDSPGLVLFLIAFGLLFVLCISALAFVPAYILWKKTNDKRYPMMWVTCSAIVVAIAAVQTFVVRGQFQRPQPINETLTNVAAKSGVLHVTALRMPNPEQPQVRIEVDAENTSDRQELLGIQCTTSSAPADTSASAQATHFVWTVEPKWKGTLTCEAQLPGILYDGEVTVVLARCNSKTPGPNNWLPLDSEAMYQNRFDLLATAATAGPKP